MGGSHDAPGSSPARRTIDLHRVLHPALRRPAHGRPRRGTLAAIGAALLLAGCGGGESASPTTVAPAAAAPAASGLDFTLIPAVNDGTVVEFRWSGSGASSYELEIGKTSGASDVASLASAGAATMLNWSRAPVGSFYARVRPRSGTSIGSASNEVLVGSVDPRFVVDALLFGYGPLAVAGNAAGPNVQDQMDGWQPGGGFELILSESLPAAHVAAVEATVRQVAPATRGRVNAAVRGRQPEPLPLPRTGEVTIGYRSPQQVQVICRCDACVGCASTWFLGSFAQRAEILVSSETQPPTVAHELGHVIGLSHIISAAGVRPPFTMGLTTDGRFSPQGRLGELDPATVKVLETVYEAGLSAGSTRRQLEALGFVAREGEFASAGAGGLQRAPGTTVAREGLETVVRRPVCQ